MRSFNRMLLAATAFLLPVSMAQSADFEQTYPVEARRWALIISPYVWAASLTGNGSLVGFNTNVDVPFSEIFEHLDLAVMGNLELTNGQWGVFADIQYVHTSQDEQVLAQDIGLDIKTLWLTGGAFFKAYETQLGGTTVFGAPRTLSVEPMAGLRWTKLEADVSVTAFGVNARRDARWVDPFVGVRLNADITDRWNLFTSVDVGGFDVGSKIAINAQAYLGYRTMLLGQPTIWRAGYRVMHQNYENDDFTGVNTFRWDVTQHGPVVGLSMRF